MKAVVFHDVGDIRLDDVPEPTLQKPTDAIVRLTASAICGTDLQMIRGTFTGMKPGTILGHEGVGVVEQLGEDVRNLSVGDRVVIPSTVGCGFCDEQAILLSDIFPTGNLELFNDVVAPNSVDHDPAPGQGAGPEGFRQFFTELRSTFPDLKIEAEQMVSDDTHVAFAYTMTGTHQGDFMGVPATGKRVSARGLQIGRFEHGKLVERWGSSDELGLLKQLGRVSIDPQGQGNSDAM